MTKEKKKIVETSSKAEEDLSGIGEKFEHLMRVKTKLMATIDEIDTAYEKEKRQKLELDKQRRKLESELKISQVTIEELQRSQKEIENNITRKESQQEDMMRNLESEQSSITKIQKQIKDYQARVEELEEELDAERQARAKAERQKGELSKELEDIGERLLEASGATASQIELNKKRETEVIKMRKDVEECLIQNEATIGNLKKRHQDATSEISDQVEQLTQIKSKYI